MPRIARVVVPKYPHHVTQRGNRRQTVFFSAEDYATYIEFLANARDNLATVRYVELNSVRAGLCDS